jgi:hypothetical protein
MTRKNAPDRSSGTEPDRWRLVVRQLQESAMRPWSVILVMGALVLSACGSTERTTVVAPPGSTVVVPPKDGGDTTIVKPPGG